MLKVWFPALLLCAAAPAPGMFRVSVSDVRVGPVDEKGNPAGELAPIRFEQRQQVACRLEKNPGTKPISIWFKGTTDAAGKLRALGSGEHSQQLPSRGGAADDAAVCAFSVFTNSDVRLTPRTHVEVRVSAVFAADRPP